MKKIVAILSILIYFAMLSSCSMYKQPCEGVAISTSDLEKKI